MAEIVPLPKEKRLRSLDEFEPPAWKEAANRLPRFGLLLCAAIAAGASVVLMLF